MMNRHENDIGRIIEMTRELPSRLKPFQEMLLANLVMIGEIPASTFHEQNRVKFLVQRFTECGLQNCSTDEFGNGIAILPGKDHKKTILLVAHVDTSFDNRVDHTYTVNARHVIGPGSGDNSLGVAVLATLPTLLSKLGIQLQSDILMLGATSFREQGNLEGLRSFLANQHTDLGFGISIEGVPLGRLGYHSMATMGGEIVCKFDTNHEHRPGAIHVLNRVIHRLCRFADDPLNDATLTLGTVEGGASYKVPARSATLRFLFKSDRDEIIQETTEEIRKIIQTVQGETDCWIDLEVFAKCRAGGLDPSHPLIQQSRRIIAGLGISPIESPHTTVISGFHEHGIPALCLGITTGEYINYPDEKVEIAPMVTGIAQLIGLLLAYDGGCCDEHK